MPNTHRRRRRDETVLSRRRRRCVLGIRPVAKNRRSTGSTFHTIEMVIGPLQRITSSNYFVGGTAGTTRGWCQLETSTTRLQHSSAILVLYSPDAKLRACAVPHSLRNIEPVQFIVQRSFSRVPVSRRTAALQR